MNKLKVISALLLLSCLVFFYGCGDDNIKSSEKSILKFTIGNIDANINQEQKSITATVPHGTDVTSLKPTVIVSDNATVAPLSGNTVNFTNPVTYYVTAEDGSKQSYTVTISVTKPSEAQLLTFSFANLNPVVDAMIAEETKSVTALVPFGTNLKAMVPTLTFKGESISPASGVAIDFTQPVKYTVKAESGAKVEYTVTITESKSSDAAISEFVISNLNPNVTGVINEETKKITINVPFGTDVTNLVPTIAFKGHTINPLSGKAANFTNPIEYIVKAQDGTEAAYKVNVKISASSEAELVEFAFNKFSPSIVGVLNTNTRIVGVDLPYGTDVTKLAPTITFKGHKITPASGVEQDFTNQVFYTIEAQDKTKYEFSVMVAFNPFEPIVSSVNRTTFKNGDEIVIKGKFADTGNTIELRNATNAPVFPDVTYETNEQINATIPGLAQPGEYTMTVKSYNGHTRYTEKIKIESKSSDAEITEFIISNLRPNIAGEINEGTKKITINVPFGTNMTNLVPKIVFKGHSISPLSGKAVDFTNPVEYIVKAEDGTEATYTVNVKVIANSEAELVEFSFNEFRPSIVGVLNTSTNIIGVDLPYGTDVTKLIPTITFKGHKITPASGVAQNFTNQVFYTIEAQDKTKYEFSVMVAFNPFDPIISSVNRTKFTNGDGIIISGKFADTGNIVELRNATNAPVLPSVTYETNKQINATIPSLAQPGEYTMTVKSYNGSVRYTEKITIVDPESLRPEITSITPESAMIGFVEKITIKGKNFRDLAGKYVTVNIRIGSTTYNTNAYSLEGMNDAVEFFIDPMVNKGIGTQYISVERNGYKSNEVAFTLTANPYPNPTITSVSTYTPVEGEKITIKGANFKNISDFDTYVQLHKSSDSNGNDVSYPHSRRSVTVLDDGTLEFTMPWAEPDGWFKIEVVANGQSTFHYTSFYVKKK